MTITSDPFPLKAGVPIQHLPRGRGHPGPAGEAAAAEAGGPAVRPGNDTDCTLTATSLYGPVQELVAFHVNPVEILGFSVQPHTVQPIANAKIV